MGKTENDFFNVLSFLKMRTLLIQIDGCSVTNSSIIQAIIELNNEAEEHLGAFPDIMSFQARNPNEINGVYHYCENLVLSIERMVMWVRAFNLAGKPIKTVQ